MIPVQWLGRVPYREALRWQHARRLGVLSGHAPEVLWMLEHPGVVTLGRRGWGDTGAPARGLGVDVVQTRRGGLATFHGPGQLVGYLIASLKPHGWTVRGTVAGIEDGVITWLAHQGIEASTREGLPGVWVGQRKICAIGMHVRRGVTMHGFALNLSTDLKGFTGFVPCGIQDGGVTSVFHELAGSPRTWEAAYGVGGEVIRGIVARHV